MKKKIKSSITMRTIEYHNRFTRFQDIVGFSKNPFAMADLLRFCMVDKIGQGVYRAVYQWGHKKGLVIKYADATEQNISEWAVWNAVKGTHYAKLFAPVIETSPCGHFLIMKYARPLKTTDKLPKKIPSFFTDMKRSNYGMIGKQLVCIDYHFLSMAFDHAAMVTRPLKWNDQ